MTSTGLREMTVALEHRHEVNRVLIRGKSNSRPIFREEKPMINPPFVELFASCFAAV